MIDVEADWDLDDQVLQNSFVRSDNIHQLLGVYHFLKAESKHQCDFLFMLSCFVEYVPDDHIRSRPSNISNIKSNLVSRNMKHCFNTLDIVLNSILNFYSQNSFLIKDFVFTGNYFTVNMGKLRNLFNQILQGQE